MGSIDSDTNEQELFAELLSNSSLDDDIPVEHQAELRRQMLDAFDRSQVQEEECVPVVIQSNTTFQWNVKNTILLVASLSACLVCVAAFWSTRRNDISNHTTIEAQANASTNVDPLLIASIIEVNAWKDEVSEEALFEALAQCEQQFEAREFANRADEMRWHYESLLTNSEIPKG